MIAVVGTFIGGLGLFLLAVSMISDGLRLAAGDRLREVLARSTRTRFRGLVAGIALTGIIQSSSAVTVATIGFVNAGLLTLTQSLGIVYGANVGTTITGWIVAVVGLSFKLELFALPMIGIGMLSRILRPGSRVGSVGEAVAGFGLFFIGVDVLRDAFEGFSQNVDLAGFAPQGGLGMVLYVALGAFMTVVTQSSSAAIAITLTAATGGVLGINAAAAMVVGANVGTTSTAAFAVVGATANARRVAAAHVAFNLLTASVAIVLLPIMLWAVRETGAALGLADAPAVSLALFHTIFNLLGVGLMWPLTNRLAEHLSKRFTTESERLGRPEFLDRNALANPTLAVDALCLELGRVVTLCRQLVAEVISGESAPDATAGQRRTAIRALVDHIEEFVSQLELERLPEGFRGNLPLVLRVTGYLEDVIGLVDDLEVHRGDIQVIRAQAAVAEAVNHYQIDVLEHLDLCDPTVETFGVAQAEAGYEELRAAWHALKDVLMNAGANRQLPVRRLNSATEGLRSYLKMAEQMTKAAIRLHALGEITQRAESAA